MKPLIIIFMNIAAISNSTSCQISNIDTATSSSEVQGAALTILDLPEEVKFIFINKLDRKTLLNLQMTCRHFRDFPLRHDVLWKNLFSSENCGYVPKQVAESWRSFYKEAHRVRSNIKKGVSCKPIRALLTNSLNSGSATFQNRHFTLDGCRRILCTDLVTGKILQEFTHIPKTAFASPIPDDEPLLGTTRIQPINETLFLVNGDKVSIWDARAKGCIFAAFCKYNPVYVDDHVVVFETKDEIIEIWDYKEKKQISKFSAKLLLDPKYEEANDRGKILQLFGSQLFALSWNCILSYYDYRVENGWSLQFKSYVEKCNSLFHQTKNHLVALSKERVEPHAFVAVSLNFSENKISYTHWKLGRPEYYLAGIESLLEFAVPYEDFMFGIDPEEKNAVTCWDLTTKEMKQRFMMPGKIWTFQVACDRVIATSVSGLDETKICIWDINNSDQPLLELKSESFDCIIHENILCIRELQQFRFVNLSTATQIGTISFTAFQQKPLLRASRKTDWTFDGSRIHIQQDDPRDATYWIVNL